MALVEMKHVDMLALQQDRHALLREMQRMGCVQLTPADSSDTAFTRMAVPAELPALSETLTRLSWAMGKLGRFDTTKKPLMADKPSIDEQAAQGLLRDQAEIMGTVEALEVLEREAGELRGQSARVEATRSSLLPWQALPLPPAQVHSTRNTVAMLGMMNKAALETWDGDDALHGLCTVAPVSTLRDQACVYVVMHRACLEAAQQKLKEANFSPVQLPPAEGTVEEQLQALEAEAQELEDRQRAVTASMAALVPQLAQLKELYDVLSVQRERLQAAHQFSASEKTFFVQGWVPAPITDTLQKRLEAVSPTVALAFSEAAEGEEPPVLLHNAPVFQPFESVVTGFSLPAPHSFDPTAIMTPFYINFMGMMISDAGYGLMMAILMPLLIKFLKPAPGTRRMLWILAAGGVATVFWGALYNTWFGFAPWPSLFDPMNNAMPVMGVCVALGAVHLFTGLGVAAYLNLRRGRVVDAISDQLSWFLLVVGLALMVVVPAVGQWIALAGAAIILVMAGRGKSKNPIKRLLSGLGALYGATSWISDLLSYMRLFGMGLATGVIGMVINILVGMAFQSGVIGMVIGAALFVGGHLFNAGINTLGAYVHSCRLQYIEFFGKFYEDGGKPFTPLADNTRYVYIREAQTPT